MEEIDISGEVIIPANLLIVNDNLVVIQRKVNPLFCFYDVNTLDFQFGSGNAGRAANEFVMINPRFCSVTNSGFITFDSPNKIKEVVIKDSTVDIRAYKTLESSNLSNNFLMFDDSTYCFSSGDWNEKGQFGITTNNGKDINYFSPFPDWAPVDDFRKLFVYLTNNCINPKKGLFAAFYVYWNRIKIFNIKGELVKDIQIALDDRVIEYDETNPYTTYYMPICDDELIYAIYQNKRMQDKFNPKTEIHVFDWNGKPIKQMFFDKSFDIFTLSKDKKNIIAINSQESNKIYRCTL